MDEGQTAPYMENAKEWSRLLQDCLDGKIDLIITQKVSNVTRNPNEITLTARVLATQPKPVGIYFVNEDIFTLASYYQTDMREKRFFPSPDWQMLPDDQDEEAVLTATKSDKKMSGNKIKFVILNEVGNAAIYRDFTDQDLLEAIHYLKEK